MGELIQGTASAWHPNIIPRHEERLLRHGSAFEMSQLLAKGWPEPGQLSLIPGCAGLQTKWGSCGGDLVTLPAIPLPMDKS